MKPQTQQFFDILKELTKDIYYSLVGDEPFVVITWETETKGNFSLENLLLDQNALIPLTVDSLRDNYQNLITFLQSNLSNLTLYTFDFPNLPSELFHGDLPREDKEVQPLGIPIILGSTSSGEWIGLIPEQHCKTESSPQFIISELENMSENTKAFFDEIKDYTTNFEYKSQDWDLTNSWKITITSSRDNLIEKLLYEGQFLDIYEIDKFLKLDNQQEGEEELEGYQRLEKSNYLQLSNLFNSQLQNSKAYNLVYLVRGEFFVVHYVLGQTQDGDYIGLITDSFTF